MFRDNLSGLKLVELGAGLTINDISILVWTPIFTNRTATLTHKIDVPDGHRSFIRLRATNHGKSLQCWVILEYRRKGRLWPYEVSLAQIKYLKPILSRF